MGHTIAAEIPPIHTSPQWETRSLVPYVDGRVPGTDKSLWMYRSVPLSSVVDARSVDEAVQAGSGLHIAFEELSRLASARMNRRASQGSYREFHLLLLNVPTFFRAPKGTPTEEYLNREFGHREPLRRELLFGVRLTPSTFNFDGSLKESIKRARDSVVHTIMYAGTPLSDYDTDTEEINGALSRAGFTIPSKDVLRWADSWWNHGRGKSIPVLPHDNHMHFFNRMSAKNLIERDYSTATCANWPEKVTGEAAVTFSSLTDLDLGFTSVQSTLARWAPNLIDAGARVISVRGMVEPQKVTRNQLRSQKKRINADMTEFMEKNKTPRDEQEEVMQQLADMEGMYARGEAPPTLTNCSVIVGFDGAVDDLAKVTPHQMDLSPMVNLQGDAWHETMLCSNVRANPHVHDLPASTIAYAGLTNISRVGDPSGALLGFTESDGQPVYISSNAASRGDSYPLMMCAAGTGSGKSLALQWLAHQWGLAKVPQVIVDPKQTSDFTPAVTASGGRVYSFDEFANSDGALDPLRYITDRSRAFSTAASMIAQVRPFSSAQMDELETPIANAIRYGVEHGATATGEALLIAADDGIISRNVVDQIIGFAETYPMFRATFGIKGGPSKLNIENGITLFKVGNVRFETPPPGVQDVRILDAGVRTSVNVMRQVVRASLENLAGRGGVLHVDEEWVYEKAAPDELESLGRLARSQNVLVTLFTQTPKGPLELGLGGFISRGLIGHIRREGDDTTQAEAGLKLFGSNSPEILDRVTAPEKISGANNFMSLKAQWQTHDDGTRTLLRPAVFYHADLAGNLAPVEITIPPSFFRLASTNPDDVKARMGGGL